MADGAGRELTVIPAAPDQGQPLSDLPPLIEPIEIVEPAETRPADVAGQRPMRRSFLAPVAGPAEGGALAGSAEIRRRAALRPRLSPPPLLAERRAAEPPPAAAPAPAATGKPSGEKRNSRWWLPAMGGAAAALVLAAGAEFAMNPDSIGDLRSAVAGYFAPSQAPSPGILNPPNDPAQRLAYYAKGARAGDATAKLALAILYAKGEGVPQDYAAAAKWFAAAAEAGIPRAEYDLGVLYERGRGVSVNYETAADWYRKAAKQNHPLAQYNLAVAYTVGRGVQKDFFQAATWYQRAATQGVVAAMVNLAILYERGEGVDASPVNAYAWYRAAARRGSRAAEQRAQQLLQAFSPLEQTHAETKTDEIAASINDKIGKATRIAAATPATALPEKPPVLKSGLDTEAAPPPAESGSDNP